MKNIVVFGAGMVAGALVRYLLAQPDLHVTVASRTLSKAEELVAGHPNGRALAVDSDDPAALEALIREADLAISLLPYAYHPTVARLCVANGVHMVTTSYVKPAMAELDEAARAAGVILLNEIGVDPGIDHMTAMRIVHMVRRDGGKAFRIRSGYDYSGVDIGASIAHAGVCLTVTAKGENWHEVEAWEEALRLTTLDGWKSGQRINLERSLKIGDELGGHMVSGHVDGLAQIAAVAAEGEATRFTLEVPQHLAKFIAPKGSVSLDGTSLTVKTVNNALVGIHVMPAAESMAFGIKAGVDP